MSTGLFRNNSWLSTVLFLGCLTLSRSWATAQEPEELRPLLLQLASSTFQPESAAADAELCRRAWTLTEELPEAERPKWEDTLLAVLAQPALRDENAPSDDDDARIRKLTQAETYYRALKAALTDVPGDLAYMTDRLLAVVLHRRGARMHPLARGPVMREAIELHQKNADYCRQHGRPSWEVCELSDLAYCYFVVSEFYAAIPVRDRAITLYRQLPDKYLEIVPLGDDPQLAARLAAWQRDAYQSQSATYLLHGLYYYNLGREDPQAARESLFLYAESLRVGMVHRDPMPISNVGALLAPGIGQETGRAKSIADLRRSLEFLREPTDNPYWRGRGELAGVVQAFHWLHARMRVPIGMFYADTGQLLVARHLLDEAETFAQQLEDAAILPMVRHAQAELLRRSGLAEDCLRKARQILEDEYGPRQRTRTLTLMAQVTFEQGDVERAVDYLRWATDNLQSRDRDKPGSFNVHQDDIPLWGQLKEVEADLCLARGQLGRALRLLREAAHITALQDEEEAIRLDLRRGLLEARATAEGYRPSPRLLAVLQNAPAAPVLDLAMRRGPVAAVTVPDWRSRVEPRLAARPSSATGLTSVQIDWLRPRFLQSEDEPLDQEARVDLKKLVERVEALRDREHQVDHLLGQVALAAGDFQLADTHYEQALATSWRIAANVLDPLLGVESVEATHRLHHEAARVAARRDQPLRALQILDMARHRAMLDVTMSGRGVWQSLNEQQRAEAAKLDEARTRAAMEVAELSRSNRLSRQLAEAQQRLVTAEGEWERFRSRMRESYRAPSPPREPLSKDAIESLLDDGEAMLVYSVGELETLAVLMQRIQGTTTLKSQEIPILRSDLEALVQTLLIGCGAAGEPYELLARELDRLLIEPFAPELATARVLVIGADGPLHQLPFAVLADEQGAYLLQRTALASLPSLSMLHRIANKPATGEGALLVDLQEFGDRAWLPSSYAGQLRADQLHALLPQYRLSPLPHTRREVDRLAELFGGKARRLNGPDAQEETVVAAAKGKRYLHFATHGLVDVYLPFQSVLVIGPPVAGSAEDGFLEAAEILDAGTFSSADLVSLSACQSGLGLVQGTEGVLGLTWALLATGNRSVVSSSWSIDDQATADLMAEFYRRILAGESKAEALQHAAFMLRDQPDTSHPSYWAAFQLIGAWK